MAVFYILGGIFLLGAGFSYDYLLVKLGWAEEDAPAPATLEGRLAYLQGRSRRFFVILSGLLFFLAGLSQTSYSHPLLGTLLGVTVTVYLLNILFLIAILIARAWSGRG